MKETVEYLKSRLTMLKWQESITITAIEIGRADIYPQLPNALQSIQQQIYEIEKCINILTK